MKGEMFDGKPGWHYRLRDDEGNVVQVSEALPTKQAVIVQFASDNPGVELTDLSVPKPAPPNPAGGYTDGY